MDKTERFIASLEDALITARRRADAAEVRAERAEAVRDVLAKLPRDCIPPKSYDSCGMFSEDAGSISEACTKCRLEWAAQEAAKYKEEI